MNCLVFQLGADRYAIPPDVIEEVIALVNLTPLAGAPPELAGEFNYHGIMVPVVDLCRIELGRPSSPRWSTRIILLPLATGTRGSRLIGMVTERATELMEFSPDTIVHAGDLRLFQDERGQVRVFDLRFLLPTPVVEFLGTHSPTPPPARPEAPAASRAAVTVEPDEPVTDSIAHDMEPVRRTLKRPASLQSPRQPRRVSLQVAPLKAATADDSSKQQPAPTRRQPRSHFHRAP